MIARRLLLVADSGPLIALGGIDQLGLLRAQYRRVVMPSIVRDEITAPPRGRPAPLLSAIIENGYFLSDRLVAEARRAVGE